MYKKFSGGENFISGIGGFKKISWIQNVDNCTSLRCRIPTTVKMKLFNMKKNFKTPDHIKKLKNKKIDTAPRGIEPRTLEAKN